MKLLASQKDSIFDIIEANGLSPYQFELLEVDSWKHPEEKTTKLFYKNSEYYYHFERGIDNPDRHYTIYCPGEDTYVKEEYPGSWEYQLRFVSRWLKYLIREISTPNKWDRLEREVESISINFDNEEDKFSVQEYEDLQRKILILKEGIPSIGLLSEQERIINEKLDYLVESAKNMKKFDWKSLFIGIMFSVIIQLEVTPDNAKSLLSLIKQVFHSFLLP